MLFAVMMTIAHCLSRSGTVTYVGLPVDTSFMPGPWDAPAPDDMSYPWQAPYIDRVSVPCAECYDVDEITI
jgi:hypothetical protein